MITRTALGTLVRYACIKCGRHFIHITFEGDVDSVTEGLCAASSRTSLDVVVLETTAEEWSELGQMESGRVEHRLAALLHRSDLFVPRVHHDSHVQPDLRGLSFQEFRQRWKAPQAWLSSPCCDGCEAKALQNLTQQELFELGGRVIVVGNIQFRPTAG